MLSKASCEYIELKRVAQSMMALFVVSVKRHRERMPNADNSTQCTFSIRWKIVKPFIESMKKVQNAFNVKKRKIIPERRKRVCCLLLVSLERFTSCARHKEQIKRDCCMHDYAAVQATTRERFFIKANCSIEFRFNRFVLCLPQHE